MNWKRVFLVVAPVVAISGFGFHFYLTRAVSPPQNPVRGWKPPAPYVNPPRPWRWRWESQWVAQQVTRHIASWVKSELGPGDSLAVRVIDAPGASDRNPPSSITLEVGPVRVLATHTSHPWDPAAYADVAKGLLGASSQGSDSGEVPRGFAEALLVSDAPSLRRADALLLRALRANPRSAKLHANAALLWAAYALAEGEGAWVDQRPFLNGIAAHLALANALGDGETTGWGSLAGQATLDALLFRQRHAAESIDRLEALTPGSPWVTALRLRLTGDTRGTTPDPRLSRLVQTELVRALLKTRSCRDSLAAAQKMRLEFAADWVRPIHRSCSIENQGDLASRSMALEFDDAPRHVDAGRGDFWATLDQLEAARKPGTLDARRPDDIVPAATRAEAALRHLGIGLVGQLRVLQGYARIQEIRQLAIDSEPLLSRLPQRAVIDLALDHAVASRSGPTRMTCERLARLIGDRPDLVSDEGWSSASRCQQQSLLSMVHVDDWLHLVIIPGTGLLAKKPWSSGLAASPENLKRAHEEAPWALSLAQQRILEKSASGTTPGEVLQIVGQPLDYSIPAMTTAFVNVHGDDDISEKLGRAICEADVEQCAEFASRLWSIGRHDAAEAMWKRALSDARQEITLSNHLLGYVTHLLNRGQSKQALAVARRASHTYSAKGLFVLAYALERLGRFEEAAREYGKISARYDTMKREQTFYIRYRQRHGADRFVEEAERAAAEVFPSGLKRRTIEDFRRDSHRGGVLFNVATLWESLRRFGVREGDFVVSVDGVAVESREQMDAALTFTDSPQLTVVVYRKAQRPATPDPSRGFIELTGEYARWPYGQVEGPVNPSARERTSGGE